MVSYNIKSALWYNIGIKIYLYMKYFFIIIALLITGVGCQKSTTVPTNANIDQDIQNNTPSEISALEQELQNVIDTGEGINPTRYDQIIKQLENLENRGASKEDIDIIRLLLSKLRADKIEPELKKEIQTPQNESQTPPKPVAIKQPEKITPPAEPIKAEVPAEKVVVPVVEETPQISPPINDEKKADRLVLYNIGINLGLYDSVTNRAGDILFTKNIDSHYGRKAFLEFGTTLTGPGGTDIMPHPTYIVPLGTKIFSPVNGKVNAVRYQAEYNDYEIVIVPDDYPSWRISFDHIIDLSFKNGDIVKINDVIAKVAPSRSSAVPSNFGLTEFQVWGENSSLFSPGPGDSTCPFLLLAENIKQNIASKITQLATEWEKYIGEDVYDEAKWIFPGCLAEKAKS